MVAQVAEKHGWTDPMVGSVALEGLKVCEKCDVSVGEHQLLRGCVDIVHWECFLSL